MQYRFLLVWIVALFLSVHVRAQEKDEAIDLGRIRMKSIRKLLNVQKMHKASDFSHLSTACYRPEDSLLYQTHVKTYVIRESIARVWEKYANMSPRKAWNGHLVHFGFLFNRLHNSFAYSDNADEPFREGNIIYVNLRALFGLKNIGVAFEVTAIDEDTKTISLCYMEKGNSMGSQDIHLEPLPNGDTRITHRSRFTSGSAFRDRELYPVYHERFINEFHHNVLNQTDH